MNGFILVTMVDKSRACVHLEAGLQEVVLKVLIGCLPLLKTLVFFLLFFNSEPAGFSLCDGRPGMGGLS